MAGNVQDYELLLKVRADLLDAVKGMKGLSESIGGVSDSAKVAGESADAATARIKSMVSATSQQEQVVESARSKAERAAATAKASAVDYDAQAAAIKRASDATKQYRDRMAGTAGRGSSSSAIDAQRAELAKLVGQIDPTVAALGRLDAQEAKLNRLRKTGVVGLEDYTRYKNTIDESRVALTSASHAVHKFSLNTAMARRELGYITKDLATGQYGRLSQSALTLASNSGIMSLAFSKAGLAIGGTTAAAGLLAFALIKGYLAEQQLNSDLIATGNYAGKTSTQLRNLADDIGHATGNYGDANKAVLLLAQSGKISGAALEQAAKGAVALAELTGKSIDQAVAAFLKFQDDPVKAIKALDDQYHFLTTDIYLQIQALVDQGNQQAAIDLSQRTAADALESRRVKDVANLGTIQRGWKSLRGSIAETLDLLKGIGSQDIAQKLDQLYLKRGVLSRLPDFLSKDKIAKIDKEISALRDQAFNDTAKVQSDSTNEKTQAAGKAAVDRIAERQKQYETAAQKYVATIKDINKDIDLAIAAAPQDADKLNAQRASQLKAAAAAFTASTPKGRTARGRTRSDAAEQRSALAAQQQLIKLLGDEQGALDPLAKIYATYNDQVTKANALADKAKLSKGANVQAIEAERDALIAIYATARDKDLAAIADKDRQAFEKLRDSLRTPVETKIDTAVKQLKELNGFLTRGTISAKEYNDALKGIGDKAVSKLPTYKGPGAAVGGPFGELQKNFRAQDELDKQYQAQLAALDKFRSTDLAQQKIYDEAKAQLDADYAQKSQVIEQSRQQLTLQSTSDFFGQIAQLQHSQNNKLAAVGKAAAIAQVLINTYQSATAAYASLAGIPYVGPALGIAAAAAAIAAGLANVAQIRSVGGGSSGGNSGGVGGGFAKGGYTGHGGKYEPAGMVHKGEVVINSAVVAKPGTRHFLEDVNDHGMEAAMARHFTGYSAGGYVDSPATSTADFPDFTGPRISPPKAPAGQGQSAGQGVSLRLVNNVDPSLIHDAMSSSAGEQVIINTISRNRSSLKQVLR